MGSGLCRSCRGTCLSVPGCLKCVNGLGFAAIGGRNLHCRVCRGREESPPGSREAWAMMEGIVEQGPVRSLIKLNINRDTLNVLHVGQICKVSVGSFPVNN